MTDAHEDVVLSETAPEPAGSSRSYDIALPQHVQDAIVADWDPAPPMPHPARADVGPHAARRRAALSAHFPATALVIPAGSMKVRSNDTDYPFRASSSFTWL